MGSVASQATWLCKFPATGAQMFNYLVFAAHVEKIAAPAGKGLSLEWAIVILAIAIGLAITLSPPRRTSEVKKSKDE
jgi:hypothetical protein